MPPHVPKYVSPKQAAEDRARRRAAIYWVHCRNPVIFALLVFGYSDQAPAALRSVTITLDQTFGYPMRRMLGVATAPDPRRAHTTERTTPPSTRSAAPVVAEACGEQT